MSDLTVRDAIAWHEQIAGDFDAGYARSPAFRERLAIWSEVMAARISAGDDVLDAGCGSGVFSLLAAQRADHVLGIDGSAAMIALCEKARQERALANLRFDQRLLSSLEREGDDSFDVILSSSVLEYVPDHAAVLADFARLLRPGGRLLVSMPNGQSLYRWLEGLMFRLTGRPRYFRHVVHVPTADELAALLARLGMRVVERRFFADPPSIARLVFGWLPRHRRKTLFLLVAIAD